jgi:hypothetical protein
MTIIATLVGTMDSLYFVDFGSLISLRITDERRPALPSSKRPRTSRLDVDLPLFGEGPPFDQFQDFGSGAIGFDGVQGGAKTSNGRLLTVSIDL